MAKVCGWHLCHPTDKTESTSTKTYQFTGSTYTIHHRGTQPRRSLNFPGQSGFLWLQHNSSHHSVQKTSTHWPVLPLGQQSLYYSQNSVFNTLALRAKVICCNQHTLQQEMDHIKKALLACSFPPWALNNLHTKFNHKHSNHNTQATTEDQQNNSNNKGPHNHIISTMVPTQKDLGKGSRRPATAWALQRQHHHQNLLMAPKDKENKYQKVV